MGFPGGSVVKNLPANAGDACLIPGSGRSPGEGNATHSRILAWETPRAEEPGGLQFMGSQKNWTRLINSNHNIGTKAPIQVEFHNFRLRTRFLEHHCYLTTNQPSGSSGVLSMSCLYLLGPSINTVLSFTTILCQ